MNQSATSVDAFSGTASLPLEARFDGGRLTSDGGLPWLERTEEDLGVCAALASVVPEWRRGPVRHRRETLVRPRVFAIASRYEDQDDADTLRTDPLLKLVCGQLPETGRDLASQPTLSRLENAVDRQSCYRLVVALGEVSLREREREGVPTNFILDLDVTDDPTHGPQEGSAYHGYYRRHLLRLLLIFDGETHQLITAILRHGNTHGSTGVVVVLKRVVRAICERWPGVSIEVRTWDHRSKPALVAAWETDQRVATLGEPTDPAETAGSIGLRTGLVTRDAVDLKARGSTACTSELRRDLARLITCKVGRASLRWWCTTGESLPGTDQELYP